MKNLSNVQELGASASEFSDVQPLDKLPTNQFIESYLEQGDDETDKPKQRPKTTSSIRNASAKFKPLPEEADELETNIDIHERLITYDDTGQQAYENACRRYKALPSGKFSKSLQESSQINLRHYNLGSRGAMAVCIPLLINNKITSVNLSANDLNARGITQLGKMMVENDTIQELNISENNLRSHGAKVIANILSENNHLQVLDISKNHFCDSDAKLLTTAIEEHPKLRVLNMSDNDFGEGSASLFKTMISENGHLVELDLSWNQFRNKGAIEIANGVRDNVGLKVFNIAWNGMGDKGAIAMSAALKTCTLSELNMTCNRIGAEGFLTMIKALKDSEYLNILDFSKNPIPEEAATGGLEFIITKLDDLHLEKLILSDIIYSPSFKELVSQVQEKFANFSCDHGYNDMYGKRRMKEYNLIQEAMGAIRTYCDEHNVKIVDLFAKFDADGSMSVSHEEFRIGLKEAKVPINEEHISELIKTLDQDDDGEIDFSEMVMGAELFKDA